jgi:hypothetical protein
VPVAVVVVVAVWWRGRAAFAGAAQRGGGGRQADAHAWLRRRQAGTVGTAAARRSTLFLAKKLHVPATSC